MRSDSALPIRFTRRSLALGLAAPALYPFQPTGFEALERSLYGKPTTSFLVIKSGKTAYTYGDNTQASYLASARKSVLSILFGKYVANGTIDLKRTIGDLGINEDGAGLLPIEKNATIADLLKSSSGVYWPGGSPGGVESTPPRGSKTPGTHFHYNNWDFNVLGAIFEKLTGKSVFRALEDDLARPLQFQDFDPTRQRMLGYESNPSRYNAYHMFLSGRDMARLGVVMANGGKWNGQQIVPADWVKTSTALHVPLPDIGYGYLWWKPSQGRNGPAWANSFLANGHYGQFILGLPAIDTVIVHRRAVPDELAIARNLGRTEGVPAGGSVPVSDFLAMAEKVVAAHVPQKVL